VRARHVAAALAAAAAAWLVVRTLGAGPHVFVPEEGDGGSAPRTAGGYAHDVPLDPGSPWPKFRANALQNGRSPVPPRDDASRRPWEFRTGKGVFSSPVVDGDGTLYVGSADRRFYAIDRDGELRWSFESGEVIDSAALLDDRGRVYFGSGDARLYALDRASGALLWSFQADSVEAVEERYGIRSYNVNWFEGNVAMLADGTLLAPNDNFLIYAVDRDTGRRKAEYLGNELMWSLPAVNTRTGRFFAGSQFLAWRNLYAFDTQGGEPAWTSGGWGSTAASPLLTSRAPGGVLVVGGFDGIVRAFAQRDGRQLWKRATRDHLYASPAQLSDGTLVQPSTDGTLYALEPRTGDLKWAYDTLGPIRASPAVDANDRIYVGNGEGRLFCIEPDGTLRWSFLLIDEERNDLNASPALGPDGIAVAGENGGVFLVPWDHPLTEAGRQDPRSSLGPGEALPGDGVFLLHTEPFGRFRVEPPRGIDANQPLAFTLFVREGGDTTKAAIDRDDLEVTVTGDPALRLQVSADGQFLVLVPRETWTGPAGGSVQVDVRGEVRTGLWRLGLKSFGGSRTGRLDRSFRFDVAPRSEAASPYRVPQQPGEPGTLFELSRFAAPQPSMLPSWNQIGFDSLHYLAGAVEGTPGRALLWVVAGRALGGRTLPDPALGLRFPLVLEYDGGLLTFRDDGGFEIDFIGSWEMPFGFYRVSARADPRTGAVLGPAALTAVAECNELEHYGRFLKLLGLADLGSGRMPVFGGLELALRADAPAIPALAVGSVRFSRDASSATATVSGGSLLAADHVFSLLLVDAASGRALPLRYTRDTAVRTNARGEVTSVSVALGGAPLPDEVRGWYLVDTFPAARGRL
jgi:outer membrane protein assembly factor BamB